MISKKIFAADGSNIRFLSDFIIRSEQFTRVYNYIYDMNGIEGDIDPNSGLYIRVSDVPNSVDLVGIDKWDLVDNSISFYVPPYGSSRVYIEVATTSEEFGDTLVQPSVERAEEAAAAAEASEAAALASQNAAASSETNAGTSAAAALASQNAAALSESNAATSATASASSATTSANSATASASSATASSSSATDSANSATASASSATASASSATDSANSATASAASASASTTSAGESATSATESESWANIAENFAVNTFKNKLINGGFDVWQRGVSFTGIGYSADRWRVNNNVVTAYQVVATDSFGNALRFTDNGSTGTYEFIEQRIENARQLQGKTVTISLDVKAALAHTEAYINLRWASGEGVEVGSLADAQTSYSRKSFTVTVPTGTDLSYLRLELRGRKATNGVGFDYTYKNIQLEEGSVATPFEQRPIGYELNLCQRYYQNGNVGEGGGENAKYADSSTTYYHNSQHSFNTTMRITPSIVLATPTYANCSDLRTNNSSVAGFSTRVTPTVAGVYRAYGAIWTADAEL